MPVMTNTLPQWTRLRLRRSAHLRDLCNEISFTTAHLIQPVFIVEGLEAAEPIAGLDGNSRLGLDAALDTIDRGVYLPPSSYEVGFVSMAHDAPTLDSAAAVLIEAAHEADAP